MLGVNERPGRTRARGAARVPARQAGAAAARQLRARALRRAARPRAARRRAGREGARHEPRSARSSRGADLPGAAARAARSVADVPRSPGCAGPRPSGCSSIALGRPGPTSSSPRAMPSRSPSSASASTGFRWPLELAAARCNLLSPRALLERLDSRLDLLRAAPGSGLTERQWTLRGAIEWSYDLLEPDRAAALHEPRRLRRQASRCGAAELVAEQPDLDILEGVESLLRNNLLTTEHAGGDEPRLGMLETHPRVRARASGGARRRRGRPASARRASTSCSPRRPSRACSARSNASGSSVSTRSGTTSAPRSTWALQAGEAEVGLRIGSALWRFWQMRSLEQEARERLEELLALGAGSTSTRAKAQTMIGSLSFVLGDLETARRLLEESLPGAPPGGRRPT